MAQNKFYIFVIIKEISISINFYHFYQKTKVDKQERKSSKKDFEDNEI